MTTPFIGEIRIVSFGYAPKGWAACDGQLLPIAQNQALYSLIGTTYGGDGQINFALPNLQARVPLHKGSGFIVGQPGGSQTVTLPPAQVPAHAHTAIGSSATGDAPVPTGNFLGGTADKAYGALVSTTPLQPATIASAGNNQPHDNMQPYLVLNFCIALQGIFPSRN